MQRQHVSSSDIDSIGYDTDSHTLEIEFLSGGIYQYLNVSESIFHGFISASSHGSYFHQHIKDKYNFRKIR